MNIPEIRKKKAEVTKDRREVQKLEAGKCGKRRLSEEGLFLFRCGTREYK